MKSLGLCVLSAVLVAGCGGPMVEVSQKFEKTTDFSSYKSYAWMEGQSRSDIKVGGGRDIDLDGVIRDAVNKQMEAKGFVEVNRQPDVLVKYHAGARNTYYTTNFGMHYHEKVGWSETESVQDGQLTVDLVDAKTETVVWRGTAWGAMNVDPNQTIVNKNVNRAVEKLFKQYPPGPNDAGGS